MKPGRQWLVFDADFFDNSFARALTERFGWAGIGLFLAYLCACKTAHIPGRLSYRTESEALEKMGVIDLSLVDSEGQPFTLEAFWDFTGRYKQTSRTTRGHTFYVSATHWEQWQNDRKTLLVRERKRRSRAESGHKNVTPETDTYTDTYIRQRDTSRKGNYQPTPPRIEEWVGDEPVDEPLVDLRSAIANLPLPRQPEVDGYGTCDP